ncbi:TPA: hypothetical protein ACS72K_003547 [Providencia alcalifaciens]
MDILGFKLTVDNTIALAAIAVPLITAILNRISRYNDLKINKLYSYYEKREKLKVNIKNNSDSFQRFVSIEMVETIEREVTKVKNVKFRNVFLYVLNNHNGSVLNKYNLKKLLEYVVFNERFKINFDKFYLKQHRYKIYFAISMLVFAISSVLFIFSPIIFASLSIDVSIVLKIITIILIFASESMALILFDKIICKSKMVKYSNALAEINASAFKPD